MLQIFILATEPNTVFLLIVALTCWHEISPACDCIYSAHLYTVTCNALLCLKFGERYLEKVLKSVKCKCLIPVVTLFVMKPRSICGKTNNTFHHCYSQNFNIYKRLFLDLINLPDTDGPESYRMWGDLRNFLLQLVDHNRIAWDEKHLLMWSIMLNVVIAVKLRGDLVFSLWFSVWEHVQVGRGELSGSWRLWTDAADRSLLRNEICRQRSGAAGTPNATDYFLPFLTKQGSDR